MTAELAASLPATRRRSPVGLVFALTARRATRSGAIWGYIFGAVIASSAISYTRIYQTPAERVALATAYGANKATSALFGPAPRLQTVAGFTAFKVSMTLIVLGAVWGLLTSTRLMRGEEDSARWDILLAGQTTRTRAAAQALAGIGSGVLVLWMLTAIITVAVGSASSVHFGISAAVFFAAAMAATAVMFLAVGAFTSQLGATRRQAAGYASTFLAVSYAVRMVADAGIGLHGLIWASPLGWVEELRPFTGTRPLAVLPIALFTTVVAIAAIRLASRRDVGASVVEDRANAPARLRLLSGQAALGVRLVRPTVLAWWVAIALSGLLFGLVAKSAGSTIKGSSVQSVFAKLGAAGTGANVVLGVCFLIVAVLVGFVAAGLVTAARSEEAGGQLEHLLARPVSRSAWLGGRTLTALLVLVASGIAGGLGAWAGAASQHSGVGFATLLNAGLNLVPPAIAIFGIGVLAFGFWPRRASIVVNGLLVWSLLIVVLGSSIGRSQVIRWALDTSVFHHMAASPAVSPHWAANAIMVTLGLLAAFAGGAGFRQRDLQAQ